MNNETLVHRIALTVAIAFPTLTILIAMILTN